MYIFSMQCSKRCFIYLFNYWCFIYLFNYLMWNHLRLNYLKFPVSLLSLPKIWLHKIFVFCSTEINPLMCAMPYIWYIAVGVYSTRATKKRKWHISCFIILNYVFIYSSCVCTSYYFFSWAHNILSTGNPFIKSLNC